MNVSRGSLPPPESVQLWPVGPLWDLDVGESLVSRSSTLDHNRLVVLACMSVNAQTLWIM